MKRNHTIDITLVLLKQWQNIITNKRRSITSIKLIKRIPRPLPRRRYRRGGGVNSRLKIEGETTVSVYRGFRLNGITHQTVIERQKTIFRRMHRQKRRTPYLGIVGKPISLIRNDLLLLLLLSEKIEMSCFNCHG